ncbi:hypothetical protein BFP97_17140 [Roseivirga sp. 4D4]|uniref:phage holin family protein n=1 Tax=Roseivirga sp. 4D4 TaxID=1889784 RepID=UPI00085382BC|nr:phage holin family protein [Roseivirga sp. 4D4]OEK03139.1 hypothetical protein BFP97_17140 [Roseivirga sp. 4D4]
MKLFDLDKLVDTLTGFLETKIELLKLDAQEESTKLIAKAVVSLMIAVLCLMALLLISIGLSNVLNSYLESNFLGYIIVGALYLCFAGIVYFRRKSLLNQIKAKSEIKKD